MGNNILYMKKKTCYVCGAPASSREHFPPKSFFPKGGNLQLKTVASCAVHNQGKSKDDQYVLMHICLNASRGGSNLPAKRFLESVLPQINDQPKFHKLLMEGAVNLQGGARAYPVDTLRFDDFFDHLVSAIFYDRFGSPIDRKRYRISHIYLNFEKDDDPRKVFGLRFIKDLKKNYQSLIETIESDKIDEVVYKYDIIAPLQDQASITIAHSFYGIFDVVSFLTSIMNKSEYESA